MKALRFHAARDLRIESVKAPQNPGPGQVRVRNRYVGICGTDLHEYASGPIFIPSSAPHPFTKSHGPQILGHEFGGTVEAIGEGVTTIAVGDRVSIQPLIMPRVGDYYAERGLFHLSDQLALAGLSWQWGGMSEAAIVHEYNVAKIPDSLSDEEAALVEPTAVAVYACDRGGVRAGNSVLVTGRADRPAHPAGRACCGGNAAVRFRSERRPPAFAEKAVPGVIPINPKRDNVGDVVRDQSEGKVGCDVAIVRGQRTCLESLRRCVRKRAWWCRRVCTRENPLDWFSVTFKDIEVRGSWAYPTWYWPRVIDLIASGALPASRAITNKITLDTAVKEGFDACSTRRAPISRS
jgi:(R,R)-butanediol dehydrogenase/meso-butanediol dehydrogenase/diacetyl reductase